MAVTPEARALFEDTLELLQPLGDITGRSMFGGFGFWEGGAMFGLISSGGVLYFKVDDMTVARYRRARSSQFAPVMTSREGPTPMPYWSVPKAVQRDPARLAEWVAEAVAVGHATAKPRPARRSPRRP